jgi:hypothetical protein
METQTSNPQPKTDNRNLLIGVVAAVVVCCCCAFTAIGGYYGWQAYQVKQAPDYQQESIPPTLAPEDFQSTQPDAQEPPLGGNTDDILRNDIWSVLSGAVSGMGCTPNGSASSIEMLQAPDSAGIWAEKWTVACTDGNFMAFNVTFVPDPSGGTNYTIDQIK